MLIRVWRFLLAQTHPTALLEILAGKGGAHLFMLILWGIAPKWNWATDVWKWTTPIFDRKAIKIGWNFYSKGPGWKLTTQRTQGLYGKESQQSILNQGHFIGQPAQEAAWKAIVVGPFTHSTKIWQCVKTLSPWWTSK